MTPSTLLDIDLIHRQRLAAGLTQRGLARALGVTVPTVARLERGDNHAELRVPLLLRLAELLNVTPAQLWRAPDDHAPEARPADDDIRLEAVLVEADRSLRREEMAAVLGWTLPRVSEALRALTRRLSGTGQRVHVSVGRRYGLRPDPAVLTDDQRATVNRMRFARTSLDAGPAKLLHLIRKRELDERRATASNSGRVYLASLLKAGLVVRNGPRLELSPDTSFSLGLD